MITIYTTGKCKFCTEAKIFFKEHDLEYEEVDANENTEQFMAALKQYGGKSNAVPFIVIGDRAMQGFNPVAIHNWLPDAWRAANMKAKDMEVETQSIKVAPQPPEEARCPFDWKVFTAGQEWLAYELPGGGWRYFHKQCMESVN